MGPIAAVVAALAALALGYRFYSRFLSDKVFGLRDDETVPAVEFEDGVDFVPTNRSVLFGHHFASIAGAAPILGPAMAIVWGWLPALVWIVFGVIFMGATHDFGALVLSVRHKGQSVGGMTETHFGRRARILFLVVIFFLIWMVGAVFAFSIAALFVKFPASILPVNLEIIVAVAIGIWVTKMKRSMSIPSVLALIGLYVVIILSAEGTLPVPAAGSFLLNLDFWLVSLLVYGFIASSLPVWLLLQPRDLINSHQLVVGLFAMFIGFFFMAPTFAAPAVGPLDNLPLIVPLLFVTVACGAISGFHGLVSSGTTSKQLACATDARQVGYGSMLMEASLAILATMAVAAGVMADGHAHVWTSIYVPVVEAGAGLPTVQQALGGFVNGAASMLAALGVPAKIGASVVAVLVISFAATSLDTSLRIQRMVIAEIGDLTGVKPLTNRWIGGLLATGTVGLLIWADKDSGAKSLWPVFGATNQVLAAITLLLVAVYLKKLKKPVLPYVAPAIFIMCITFTAMGIQVFRDLTAGNWLVGITGSIIAILTGWVAVEGVLAWRRSGHQAEAEQTIADMG